MSKLNFRRQEWFRCNLHCEHVLCSMYLDTNTMYYTFANYSDDKISSALQNKPLTVLNFDGYQTVC